jgi:hypothetical protein
MKSLLVGIGRYLCKVYNYHDSRACGYNRSGILFWLDGMDGNAVELVEPLWNLCDYFVPVWPYFVIYLNSTWWVVSACNFDLINSMLIIHESRVCAFLLTALCLIFPFHYLYISFIYCTCWVPIISVLNLAIFPCHSNLLLRRRRWTGILQQGVLGYALPRLLFLWCYGVSRCSISLRVIFVLKNIFM